MKRFLIVCQDCDSEEFAFETDQDRADWEGDHNSRTGHEGYFRRTLPDPFPAPIVNGRYRLIRANFSGKCKRCSKRYQAGAEIERLEYGRGYAGPCCLTPPPTAQLGDDS